MGFPIKDVLVSTFSSVPSILIHPIYAPLFWIVVLLVSIQYRRIASLEKSIYGFNKASVAHQTVTSLIQGMFAGLLGSLLMVGVGVTLTGSGVQYLLPLALLLMLVNVRFLCFSYAGGLLSLSYLIFGWPSVNVGGLMALIAVLHFIESVLIYFTGWRNATAVYVKRRSGDVVGAFHLQRFWPVPIMVMLLAGTALPQDGLIPMPDWWPLIRPEGVPSSADVVYLMVPLVAALGYGDMAITLPPRKKSAVTASMLAGFSMVLLLLSIGGSKWIWARWAAALFGPAGHELVIWLGVRIEARGRPLYPAQARLNGVRIMDVVPYSTGDRLGIRSGDVVVHVNGKRVSTFEQIKEALWERPGSCIVGVMREGKYIELSAWGGVDWRKLGIMPVPEPDDHLHLELRQKGPIYSIVGRINSLGRCLRHQLRKRHF